MKHNCLAIILVPLISMFITGCSSINSKEVKQDQVSTDNTVTNKSSESIAGNKTSEGKETSPGSSSTSGENKKLEPDNNGEWINLSERGFRVQGIVEDSVFENGELKQVKLKCTKNLKVPTNPVVYDFTGKTLDIFYSSAQSLDENIENFQITRDNIKKGAEVAVTFTYYNLHTQDGKDDKRIMGAVDIRYIKNGKFYNLAGEVVSPD